MGQWALLPKGGVIGLRYAERVVVERCSENDDAAGELPIVYANPLPGGHAHGPPRRKQTKKEPRLASPPSLRKLWRGKEGDIQSMISCQGDIRRTTGWQTIARWKQSRFMRSS
jgi:hypothetical protein